MSWSDCVVDKDYEIYSDFPFDIRKKSTGRYLSESLVANGYRRIYLNQKQFYKHVVVLTQFKPHEDTDEKLEVDHINRDRTDYHLSNLRWVSHSENMSNKTAFGNSKCEYADDLPDEAIVLKDYGKNEFEDLYFHEDVFYKFNGINYRKLHICETKGGYLMVCTRDINHKFTCISYSKFKKVYDLL
jgi:hypothetical protein